VRGPQPASQSETSQKPSGTRSAFAQKYAALFLVARKFALCVGAKVEQIEGRAMGERFHWRIRDENFVCLNLLDYAKKQQSLNLDAFVAHFIIYLNKHLFINKTVGNNLLVLRSRNIHIHL